MIGESGEVVLPPEIRSALRLKAGSEWLIERTGAGVLLKPATTGGGLRLEDLRGFLKTEGPILPLDHLCKPVDLLAAGSFPASGERSDNP